MPFTQNGAGCSAGRSGSGQFLPVALAAGSRQRMAAWLRAAWLRVPSVAAGLGSFAWEGASQVFHGCF